MNEREDQPTHFLVDDQAYQEIMGLESLEGLNNTPPIAPIMPKEAADANMDYEAEFFIVGRVVLDTMLRLLQGLNKRSLEPASLIYHCPACDPDEIDLAAQEMTIRQLQGMINNFKSQLH